MRGIGSFCGAGLLLLTAGCGLWSDSEPTVEEQPVAASYTPLRTTDDLRRSESKASAALPLSPASRGRAGKLDDNTLARLRKSDRGAWIAYNQAIQSVSENGAEGDALCRQALEALIRSALRKSGVPLSREHVVRGLELVESSGRREHAFSEPGDRIRALARRRRSTPDGKLVRLYIDRYDLYRDLLEYLAGCGLTRNDVYWTPTFTLLDLELRGVEEKYLKIIDSPEWK